MNSITDYKGLILITFIIMAILYFSPDLECMLLFSGILVNIITICLNTGALKIPGSDKNESFVSENFSAGRSEEKSADNPDFERLAIADDLEVDLPKDTSSGSCEGYQRCGVKPDTDKGTFTKLRLTKIGEPDKYKGAIDFENASEPIQIGADRIPLLSTTHQGINSRRQIIGQYNRRSTLYPAIARELDESESKLWWGNYDDVGTINPKDAPW